MKTNKEEKSILSLIKQAVGEVLTERNVAVKKDLESFPTKFDLNRALENQEDKFEVKITEFKDEFYTRIDPILKEVVASREDRTIGAEQHRRNEDRIEKLEKIHPQGKHLATI